MIRYFSLLSFALLGLLLSSVPSAWATPQADEHGTVRKELNQFVQEAIRQGLLDPAGSAEDPGGIAGGGSPVPAIAETPIGTPGPDTDERLLDYGACTPSYPLDFSDLDHFEGYSDIINFRTELIGDEASDATRKRLGRAYIALDLGSEALMSLDAVTGAEAMALTRVAELIDGRQRPDVGYFQYLSGCHETASLWLGIALLADGKASGAALLDTHFNEFRALPRQLRMSLASIVMPGLDAISASFLAQKLLASFDKKLVRDSAQLQFANAVYELSQGSREAEVVLRTFLLKGRFQEEALFSLMRHGRDIDGSLRSVLLDNMIKKIDRAEHDDDVNEGIRYVLEELNEQSRYLTILDMASRPNMQGKRVQDQIRATLMSALERDLNSGDRLRNLAAIEALVAESGILDPEAGRKRLYEQAALKAVRLGFATLADRLIEKVYPGEDVLAERGRLAYRMKDYQRVFSLAQDYPANAQMNFSAALGAISIGDPTKTASFISRTALTDEVRLELIEHDAAVASWVVPDEVYSAALAVPDESMRQRAQKIITLRRASGANPPEPAAASIASVPERLMSVRLALDSLDSEGN